MLISRNSIFFNKRRAEELKKELSISKKQVIVYMPTWRGVMTNRESEKQIKDIYEYLNQIDNLLSDNQIFYVKLHTLVSGKIDCNNFKRVKYFDSNYETYDFLNMADCLVTDYSSVFSIMQILEKGYFIYL